MALWKHASVTVLKKLKSAYVNCLKMFFNFHKYSSVSDMFVEIGLLSFGTVCHNAQWSFVRRVGLCHSRLVHLVDDFC